MKEPNENSEHLTRRILLHGMAVTGLQTTLMSSAAASPNPALPTDALKGASTVFGEKQFAEERLKVIAPALQQNIREFAIVRDLRIADLVEPAPIFVPTRHDQLPTDIATDASGSRKVG